MTQKEFDKQKKEGKIQCEKQKEQQQQREGERGEEERKWMRVDARSGWRI